MMRVRADNVETKKSQEMIWEGGGKEDDTRTIGPSPHHPHAHTAAEQHFFYPTCFSFFFFTPRLSSQQQRLPETQMSRRRQPSQKALVTQQLDPAPEAEPPRRKPGRPRKNPLPADPPLPSLDQQQVSNFVNRGRCILTRSFLPRLSTGMSPKGQRLSKGENK